MKVNAESDASFPYSAVEPHINKLKKYVRKYQVGGFNLVQVEASSKAMEPFQTRTSDQ